MGEFTPRLDILPAAQRRLWDELSQVPPEFTLYGGTAVALHLGHRESVDFDFFGDRPLDPSDLLPSIPFLAGAEVTQREPSTLSCMVSRGGAVKISFFGVPKLPRLRAPETAAGNGLKIASLLDLAGTKAAVVQMRAEAKDYIDIDAMIADGRVDLPHALAAAAVLYGDAFNPQVTLKSLSYFAEGDLGILPENLRARIGAAVRRVDLARLPDIGAIHAAGRPNP